MDLFEEQADVTRSRVAPLAERMRPTSLEEIVGQNHVLGTGKPLRFLIESGTLTSIILWGPPGSGKTTLARLIARYTKSHFVAFSAVTSGVEDVRRVIREAKERLKFHQRRTILFIDEIHRFNKAQQDAILPHAEDGTIILVGATTENPSFAVNAPLISRSNVYVLHALADRDVATILKRARKRFFPKLAVDNAALLHMVSAANGDARAALNFLELAAATAKNRVIDMQVAEEAVQKKAIYYDKKGDFHYDTISAFIKSMRGSDENATLYWLARMIKAGEDPVFIARRMVIFASEDVGMADSQALSLSVSCMQGVHMIGMPEAGILLSHVAVYLAKAPKSRATYDAYGRAMADVDERRLEPVPLHLRNAVTDLMKELGYGKRYSWDKEERPKNMNYLPPKLQGRKYYNPDIDLEKRPSRK
jgi:putative ATPase